MAFDWETFTINNATTVLLAAVKNPAKVAKLSRVLRKLRDTLNALDLGD